MVQKIKMAWSWEGAFVIGLLLMGFVLRLRQYLTGRSLWLDEAMLALNIVKRDFAGLLRPLDYDQGAPVGFLFVEKTFVLFFGANDYALRLFPFLAGVLSMWLFYLLIRRTGSGIGLLTALALFVIAPKLVYYSSEVKQYIVDVALAILLLLLAIPLLEGRGEKKQLVWLGLAGVLAVWLSHPALFVLASIELTLLVSIIWQRDRERLVATLGIGVAWSANLALLYLISLRGLSRNTFLLDYWRENFMPLPLLSNLQWFEYVFKDLVDIQIGLAVSTWAALILLGLGCVSLFHKKKIFGSAVLLVSVLALVASGLRLYPIGGRLSLFLVPLALLLVGQGIELLQNTPPSGAKLGKVVALLVGGYLLYSPVVGAGQDFINPKQFEHIRPALAFLSENWKDGDALYVSNGALPAYRYYASRYGLERTIYLTSESTDYVNPENIAHVIARQDGNPRTWILISHVYELGEFNEKDFLLLQLDSMGKKKREFREPGTSVYLYLYDLSP